MKAIKLLIVLCLAGFILNACSHGVSNLIPSTADRHTASVGVVNAVPLVENRFEKAQDKNLRDSDIDAYIDISVTGADRQISRKLMAMMPPKWRGDFIYVQSSGRMISNNPEQLRFATLSTQPTQRSNHESSNGPARSSSASRRIRSYYHDPLCSPPDPVTNSGPYGRMVSICGFTGAIGIVDVPCNTSYMGRSDDNGYLYFEVAGNSGGDLVEGGLDYKSDHFDSANASTTGIAPYYHSTTGKYTNLNSNGFHYSCDQNLIVAHGLINGSTQTYTFTAQVGAGFDPSSYWAGQQFTNFPNPAWAFYDAPGNMNRPSTDAVGLSTPCRTCSISQVVTIGQVGDHNDASYFGIDSGGNSAIHWQQVAFGEWRRGCQQGASFCYLDYSTTPSKYYGGEEYYYGTSDDFNNVEIYGPLSTGYGPWESYEGISLPGSDGLSRLRRPTGHASGAFVAPSPSCAADGQGYCVYTASYNQQSSGCYDGNGTYWNVTTGSNQYLIQVPPNNTLQSFTDAWVFDGGSCTSYEQWTPYEPGAAYNDPLLP